MERRTMSNRARGKRADYSRTVEPMRPRGCYRRADVRAMVSR